MVRFLLVLVCLLGGAAQLAAQRPPTDPADPAAGVIARLEAALAARSEAELAALAAPGAAGDLEAFASRWLTPELTGVTVRERDRLPLTEGGTRIVVEALLETGPAGRLGTWQIDLAPGSEAIAGIEVLGSVDGLYRLALDVSRPLRAADLRVTGEDFELRLPSGTVFMAEAAGEPTVLVLLGRGTMIFSPAPETERGQLRLFAGSDTLRAEFDAAFLRLNPAELTARLDRARLHEGRADRRTVQAAESFFRDRIARSFSLDLPDLSEDVWSIVPTPGDMLADVRTRRYRTLTYARSGNEPEDVTLFDRDRRKNISVYASRARLEARGPFYDEDELAELDVRAYAVDASFSPERRWLDARARLTVRVRAHALGSVRLRLASTLAVRSVQSDRFGRMLYLRVRGQDSLIVNLPGTVLRGTEITFTVAYAGPVEAQGIEQEALAAQAPQIDDRQIIEPEESFLFSNRSYWYPQSPVTDYGTATIRMTVPPPFAAICSGEPAEGSPVTIQTPGGGSGRLHVFNASRPVRYLGCVVGRLVPGEIRTVAVPRDETRDAVRTHRPAVDELRLSVHTSPRLRGRGRELLERAADIAGFYAGLMQDAPFPTLDLAVLESHVPGGHSPAYFAAVNQPLPTSPFSWRNDPAAFDNYPEFYLAHEIAHQWWGQAVGWRNYHEQWLSEGFAQYFAALYAEHRRGPDVFEGIIRSMNRWAVQESPQGPVYLGYRLGHLRNDGRVFRALVYNKGAMTLHMLRRLTGDETFFRALRRFYADRTFTKAGTDHLRQAFEAETGHDWTSFFEQWIYGAELPRLETSWGVEGSGDDRTLAVRLEQTAGVFEFPVTVTVRFTDRSTRDVVLAVSEKRMECRIPAERPVRAVQVNRDHAALLAN